MVLFIPIVVYTHIIIEIGLIKDSSDDLMLSNPRERETFCLVLFSVGLLLSARQRGTCIILLISNQAWSFQENCTRRPLSSGLCCFSVVEFLSFVLFVIPISNPARYPGMDQDRGGAHTNAIQHQRLNIVRTSPPA